jgi:hypothetical protein
VSLPEGLILTLDKDNDDKIVVQDAKEVTWLVFERGGAGDPFDWAEGIIAKTCESLGIETAFNEYGDQMTVEEFLKDWGYSSCRSASG